ncbi:hypothetical protein NDU88_004825 [Pleurodeles waltl]|uniref:Uncharacterized protein n=1 Tax=Pleurodeles waltl TaxID=8319 RepID=A0AAV7TTP1_PLEWA|nr:hypothetical protein NDU88_004825 [Pleurodeles waltl]
MRSKSRPLLITQRQAMPYSQTVLIDQLSSTPLGMGFQMEINDHRLVQCGDNWPYRIPVMSPEGTVMITANDCSITQHLTNPTGDRPHAIKGSTEGGYSVTMWYQLERKHRTDYGRGKIIEFNAHMWAERVAGMHCFQDQTIK